MQKSSFELLPTGKPHISFSEVKLWKECSYRHNLIHVKKIDVFKPSPILDFGTSVHSACENYLLTKQMDATIAHKAMEKAWERNKDSPEFTVESLEKAKQEAEAILQEVPAFLSKEFPEWEVVDAEHQLYEAVENQPHAFKGFIDGVIKAKGKRGETIYWILDWKTTARGWFREKRSDEMVKAQLALYKNFVPKEPAGSFQRHKVRICFAKKISKSRRSLRIIYGLSGGSTHKEIFESCQ